jgi:predicted permease
MQIILQDLRRAVRQLRKAPGFTLTAVLTLALGIGANTGIFSVMNAVLLRSLPVRDPQHLVYLRPSGMPPGVMNTGDPTWSVSENVFEQLRAQRSIFQDLIAFVPLSFDKVAVRYGSEPEEATGDMVSGNFFDGLGIQLARGHAFTLADEKKHSPVVVLSYNYWTRRFARNPSVLGQTLFIKGVPCDIIGVAAPGFEGIDRAQATDFWIPLQNRPELNAWGRSTTDGYSLYGSPNWWCIMMLGRLAPGLTSKQAEAGINPVFQHAAYSALGTPKPDEKKPVLRLDAARGIARLNEEYKQPITLLMFMVGLVLVIACSNVIMLLVARNSTRQREFSLRLALGAGRLPLLRQLLNESLILVVAGAGLGWLFALWATHALSVWSELNVSLAPDRNVLLFNLGVACLAALVFGVAPLRKVLSTGPGLVLKTSTATANQDKGKARIGNIAIALQMSVCLVLLVAAGLLLRTLRNYATHDLGLRMQGLIVFGINPQGLRSDPETIHFYQTLLDRLRVLPGVESATIMENRLGSGWSDNNDIFVDGANPFGNSPNDSALLRSNTVGPDFFHVLGIPIVAGRDITDADTTGSQKVAVINETFAKRYLPHQNPLGHRIGGMKPENQRIVIGVVKDSKYTSVDESPMPMAWYPYMQTSGIGSMHVEVHTFGNPIPVLSSVRGVLQGIDPNLPLQRPLTQQAQFEESYSGQRLFARLASFFGGLAAILVAIGLYGTLSYRINRRTIEIGVRLALGAQRRSILWMVLRQSLWLTAIGIGLGLPLAFFSARLLQSMLFGLSPYDPLTFIAALAGVILVAVAATLIPARRAASIDPMNALRAE